MASIRVEVIPSGAPLGAEIRGVDLAQPLDAETFDAVRRAFDQYSVVVFRKQNITPDQQIAFAERFGELELMLFSQFTLPERPKVLLITNIQKDGKYIGVHDAGREWHADSTYAPDPSVASMLYAHEVPMENGEPRGDTLFVPAWGLFEEFDTDRQKLLASMSAWHRMDMRLVKPGQKRPQTIHPVVVRHPRTGRKCIFVNEGRTTNFVGMDEAESKVLLRNLLDALKAPHRIYRHKWQVGDFLMWDNIAVQHLATHDYQWPAQRRLMHRTTVKGQMLSPAGMAA